METPKVRGEKGNGHSQGQGPILPEGEKGNGDTQGGQGPILPEEERGNGKAC